MRIFVPLLLSLILSTMPIQAQEWSTILSPSRAANWAAAGAKAIPNRTTICQTLTSSATAAQINTAIQNCPSGQVVFLNAGTYTIGSPGITFNGKSSVTLRGAGPNATILKFVTENPCGGPSANICMIGSASMDVTSHSPNTATWTAGYSQGATSITLSSKTNLQVGSPLFLGQAWDGAETGNVYVCHGVACAVSGGNPPAGNDHEQNQLVTVTSISGSGPFTIGITPGLHMPNWRSSQKPHAIWPNGPFSTGMGVEDLTVDGTSSPGQNNIEFIFVTNSWIKGVRSIAPRSHHVKHFVSSHNTVRDSYFWGGQSHAQESYGIDAYVTSDDLIENNIFQYVSVPMMNEDNTGSVFAYNFSIDNFFLDGTWAQGSMYTHSESNNYLLFESNDGYGLSLDNYHGPALFITAFRNRMIGYESRNTAQTVPIFVNAFNRYANIVGNVLGTSGYHTNYQKRAGIDSQDVNMCYHSIYAIGYGGACESVGTPADDSLVHITLMRWGNYDVGNAGARFVGGEVPSGIIPYSNSVPASQALPPSFYLSEKPAFFGTQSWPAIGPDVTGGSEPGVGGHNTKIPARRCFEDVMNGTFGQRTSALAFDIKACYGSSGGSTTPPPTPTNLQVL